MGSNARRWAGSIALPDHGENAGGTTVSGKNASPAYGRSTGLVGRFGSQGRKSSVVPTSSSPKRTRSALGGRRLTTWTFASAGELRGSSGLAAGQGTVMILGAEHFRGSFACNWCST